MNSQFTKLMRILLGAILVIFGLKQVYSFYSGSGVTGKRS
jgi:hypothetical protein